MDVQVHCPGCGRRVVTSADTVRHLTGSSGRSALRFTCPGCGLMTRPLTPDQAVHLGAWGVPAHQAESDELLEPRDGGQPLTAELIDTFAAVLAVVDVWELTGSWQGSGLTSS